MTSRPSFFARTLAMTLSLVTALTQTAGAQSEPAQTDSSQSEPMSSASAPTKANSIAKAHVAQPRRLNSRASQTVKPRPKSNRPPEPPRSSYSLAPVSFTILRLMQLNQAGANASLLYSQTGLNTPGSTYLLSTIGLRSSTSARSLTDYSGFFAGLNFYSPQFSGFGLASTLSVAGASTDTWRGGPYHVFMTRLGSFSLITVNHLLLNNASGSIGRFLNLWLFSFAGGLISSIGSITYTWSNDSQPQVNTLSIDPTITLRIYQSLRLAVSYTHSRTGDISTSTSGVGLEFNQSF